MELPGLRESNQSPNKITLGMDIIKSIEVNIDKAVNCHNNEIKDFSKDRYRKR